MKYLKCLFLIFISTCFIQNAHAAKKIVIDGSTTVGPIAKAFAEYYMNKNKGVNITISESGSGNGAKSLINGSCQLANMSRFMKDKEFKSAISKNIIPVPHIVAMDGIAMSIHPSNPVKNLTLSQIRKIYKGDITNWKQVGGPDKKIIVISRDTNSGTYESFHKLVMTTKVNGQKTKHKIFSGAETVGSNGAVKARLEKTRGAIGYLGLGFVDRKVKAIKVNGITPSGATINDGSYPIARPLYMFTNRYPELGSHLHRFVTLHLSKDGQKIIKKIGFTPVTQY